MSKSNPGGLCNFPVLDWANRSPKGVGKNGDIYFQPGFGLEESTHIYVGGNKLAERFAKMTDVLVIGEVGFGVGLNFLASCQAFLRAYKHKANQPRLVYVAFEPKPFSSEQMRYALNQWSQLGELTQRLIAIWPPLIEGCYPLWFAHNIQLVLHFRSVQDCRLQLQANAWYLDAFSPANDPDAWSDEVIGKIAKWSMPGTTLSTFSVASKVRNTLSTHGFVCTKVSGFGKKRHMLVAEYLPRLRYCAKTQNVQGEGSLSLAAVTHDKQPQPLRIAVIGGGLAGMATAWSLCQLGAKVHVFERRHAIAQRASSHANAMLFAKPGWLQSPYQQYVWSCWCYMWSFLLLESTTRFGSDCDSSLFSHRFFRAIHKEIIGDGRRIHAWVTAWKKVWRTRAHGNWLVPEIGDVNAHPSIKILRSGLVNMPMLAQRFASELVASGGEIHLGQRVDRIIQVTDRQQNNIRCNGLALVLHTNSGRNTTPADEALPTFDKLVIAANTGSERLGVGDKIAVTKGQVYTHTLTKPITTAFGTSQGYVAPLGTEKNLSTQGGCRKSTISQNQIVDTVHLAQSGGEFMHNFRSLRSQQSRARQEKKPFQHWQKLRDIKQLNLPQSFEGKSDTWAEFRTNGRDHWPIVGEQKSGTGVYFNLGYGGKGSLAIVPTSFWLAQRILQTDWGLPNDLLDVLDPKRFA